MLDRYNWSYSGKIGEEATAQSTITFSKLTRETLEQGMKYIQS